MATNGYGVSVTTSSDYAAMTAGSRDFYYGYEFGREPDPEDEGDTREVWGFIATDGNDTVVRLSYEEMARHSDCPDRWDCQDCLLFGIGLFLAGERR